MSLNDTQSLTVGATARSLVFPLLAAIWFAALVAANGFSHQYFVDASIRGISPTRAIADQVGPSLAARGVEPGDILDLGALSTADRFRANGMTQKGRDIRIEVIHKGSPRMIQAPAVRLFHAIPLWDKILAVTTGAFALSLLAFVGYRKPSSHVAFLIFFVGGALLSWPGLVSYFASLPDVPFVLIAYVMRTLCTSLPVMLLASFAIRFGADDSPRRRRVIHVVDAAVAIWFLTDGLLIARGLTRIQFVLAAAFLLTAACISLAWAKPAERGRVSLVFVGIMIGGVGYALAMLGNTFGMGGVTLYLYASISVIVIPLTLAYAILRYRVFDITFVLNRALVYATTSALLLVVFAALEFVTENYLTSLTHVEGALVEFVIAMAVIIFARIIHTRVDKLIDTVFFRTRHQQEAALRRFATTLQFYTEQRPLVRETAEILQRCGSVTGVAIYLTHAGTLELAASTWVETSGAIEENDFAYVELRAHRQTVELHGLKTTFPGARLYPMMLCGRLVGAVAVGERQGSEQMPPDIDQAIARVTESVAISIAAIETDAVRQENALLQQRLSTVASTS